MGELHFIPEDPTNVSSRYTRRIPQATWQRHRSIIRRLHNNGLTRRQILQELGRCDFHPSFGQLVSLMMKWGLLRYTKPSNSTTSSESMVPEPSGILRVARALSQSEQQSSIPAVLSTLASSISAAASAPSTAEDLPDLVKILTLTPDSISKMTVNVYEGGSASIMRSLSTPYMLFLGEAYKEAYQAYRCVQQQLSGNNMSIEQEQATVQALIGCLKSATTILELNEATELAQHFLDNLNYAISSTCNTRRPPRLVLGEEFQQWDNKDCVIAKVVFDLITTYKSSRSWFSPEQIRWAHNTTVREWMYSRFVRLPTWDSAVSFLSSSPRFQMDVSTIFNSNNIHAILKWGTTAIENFGHIYNTQLAQLRPWSNGSLLPWRALLFWRFEFFAKHSETMQCPSLEIRLSHDSTFVASSTQTMCILAFVLFEASLGEQLPCLGAPVHQSLLLRLQFLSNRSSQNDLARRFWQAARKAIVPFYEERRQPGL